MKNIVLVIDDDPAHVDLLAAQFLQSGWLVQRALRGVEGIALMRRHLPNVVVCDLAMPGLSGFDIAEFIRATFGAERPVLVAMTSWTDPAIVDQAHQAGFDLAFAQPIDFTQMFSQIDQIRTLRSVQRKRSSHSPR